MSETKEKLLEALPEMDEQMAEAVEAVKEGRPLREVFGIPERDVVVVLQNAYRLSEAGEFEKAETLVEGAKSLDVTLPDSHVTEGDIKLEQERYEEALESFRRAVELEPERWETQLRTAEVEIKIDQRESARERLETLTSAEDVDEDIVDRANILLEVLGSGPVNEQVETGVHH